LSTLKAQATSHRAKLLIVSADAIVGAIHQLLSGLSGYRVCDRPKTRITAAGKPSATPASQECKPRKKILMTLSVVLV
jgi:hypothetical protein